MYLTKEKTPIQEKIAQERGGLYRAVGRYRLTIMTTQTVYQSVWYFCMKSSIYPSVLIFSKLHKFFFILPHRASEIKKRVYFFRLTIIIITVVQTLLTIGLLFSVIFSGPMPVLSITFQPLSYNLLRVFYYSSSDQRGLYPVIASRSAATIL